MKSQNEAVHDLKKQINQIKRCYSTVIYLFENGDIESTILIAHRTMLKIRAVFEQIKKMSDYNKAYIDMVMANRIPQFSSDLRGLSEMEKSHEINNQSNGEKIRLMELVEHMEIYISVANKEIMTVFLIEGFSRRILKYLWNHKIQLVKIAFPSLLIIGGIWSWKHYQLRNHSLKAEYFYDMNLTDLYKIRRDKTIDFSWGYSSPFWGFNVDHFSVRWTGFIKAPEDGIYEFQAEGDDGVRLFIDGQNVIDDWTTHAIRKSKGAIELTKGPHELRFEYFEYNANAEVRLMWKLPSKGEFSLIPSEYLVSEKRYL
jgi:hypothetical protein